MAADVRKDAIAWLSTLSRQVYSRVKRFVTMHPKPQPSALVAVAYMGNSAT
jgi:hypothetical protein